MNSKTPWLIVPLLLVVAVALTGCKRKEAAHTRKSGRSPLHDAASNGRRTADVEKLLANGQDVDSPDKSGMTALHTAGFLGHIETVKVLIAHGANVNAMDDRGQTPLHLAAHSYPEKKTLGARKEILNEGTGKLQEVIMFKDNMVVWVLEYILGGVLVVLPLASAVWPGSSTHVVLRPAQLFVVSLGVILISCASSMRQRMLLAKRLDELADQLRERKQAAAADNRADEKR